MRAAVLTAYGRPDSFAIVERDAPEPGEGELRIAVHFSTVTAGDGEIRRLDLPWLFRLPIRLWMGWSKPRLGQDVLGMEVAGVVQSVGEEVTGFAAGDRVCAATGMGFGGCAEVVCVPAAELVAKLPETVSFEQAAALPIGGLAALNYLRGGGIRSGARVLVRGAGGSIGSYAVQLAKHLGATVTGLCAADDVERVRDLGADEALDYTTTDFPGPETYDVVLDVVGRVPLGRCLRALTAEGRYVRATVPGVWELLVALFVRWTSQKRIVLGDAGGTSADLAEVVGLVEQGVVQTCIDRVVPLEAIAEAHRAVDSGHKRGNVLVVVQTSRCVPTGDA